MNTKIEVVTSRWRAYNCFSFCSVLLQWENVQCLALPHMEKSLNSDLTFLIFWYIILLILLFTPSVEWGKYQLFRCVVRCKQDHEAPGTQLAFNRYFFFPGREGYVSQGLRMRIPQADGLRFKSLSLAPCKLLKNVGELIMPSEPQILHLKMETAISIAWD